jgi:hypothetical protein
MLARGECGFDVFGLFGDGQGEDHGVDVRAQEQVVVGLAGACIVRVEIDGRA